MHSVEGTPSVNFTFQDETGNHTREITHDGESDVKYEFSRTNQKKIVKSDNAVLATQLNINKFLVFQTTPSVHNIKTEQFFDEFQSRFVVSFDEEDDSDGVAKVGMSRRQVQNQEIEQINTENTVETFQQVRLSLPSQKTKPNYFGISINNQNGLKSQIFTFKNIGCFHYQKDTNKQESIDNKDISRFFIHSDRINENKDRGIYQLPQLNHPKTCKSISSNLYFTSKATPRDYGIAKKAYQKFCSKEESTIKGSSIFSKINSNKNRVLRNNFKKQNKKCIQQSNDICKGQKSNFFIKLPSLR